jgi:hypothetical protein
VPPSTNANFCSGAAVAASSEILGFEFTINVDIGPFEAFGLTGCFYPGASGDGDTFEDMTCDGVPPILCFSDPGPNQSPEVSNCNAEAGFTTTLESVLV